MDVSEALESRGIEPESVKEVIKEEGKQGPDHEDGFAETPYTSFGETDSGNPDFPG
ncbi:hypothetical protein LINPERHAP1_LOCUS5815 [Linum perenne]